MVESSSHLHLPRNQRFDSLSRIRFGCGEHITDSGEPCQAKRGCPIRAASHRGVYLEATIGDRLSECQTNGHSCLVALPASTSVASQPVEGDSQSTRAPAGSNRIADDHSRRRSGSRSLAIAWYERPRFVARITRPSRHPPIVCSCLSRDLWFDGLARSGCTYRCTLRSA